MLLDAHSHLDKYDDSLISQITDEINSHKICTISVAMDIPSYERISQLASKSLLITPAFGIHPWNASEYIGKMDELKPLIEKAPIIGEIGLDYHFVQDVSRYPAQRYVFEYFIKEARAQSKIVNIHTKGAEAEVLAMMGCYQIKKAIIHWYSGPLEILEKYLEQGYYLTLGVEILFSEHIQQVCRMIPDHLILTETDNPGGYQWLTKEPGMPSIVKEVVKKIAEVRESTPEQIEKAVWSNFKTLIKDDPNLNTDLAILD